MNRIWVFSELYYPEITSTGYFLTKISEALALDFPVSVITGSSSLGTCIQTNNGCEEVNHVRVYRASGTKFNKDFLLGRIVNMITVSFNILLKGFLNCRRHEIILVVTNPPVLPFIVLILKYLKGCQFVLLIHDVYPDVLVVSKFTSQNSIITNLLNVANKILYRKAIKIITLGRDMSKLVRRKGSLDSFEKIICIPNWADLDNVYPMQRMKNLLLEELDISDKFVVLYAGNIGRTHDVEIIVNAAEILNITHKNIHFLIIGSGSYKSRLEKLIKESNVENITLISFRPDSEKVISINACDVALIPFRSGMAGVSVPSRMYNQMASGKPLIAVTDSWSEISEIIHEERIGWVVEPGKIQNLVDTIILASENIELCSKMGKLATEAVLREYNYEAISNTYRNLFSRLALELSFEILSKRF